VEDKITQEKVDKYFEVTGKALEKVATITPQRTHLSYVADDFYNMAKSYYEDAFYFYENQDLINAFAALNYAHGWLDAGARLGLWDVGYDSKLFTVD